MHSKLLLLAAVPGLLASSSPVKRDGLGDGQPIDGNGKGAPSQVGAFKRNPCADSTYLGGTDVHRDKQNTSNLGAESTDNEMVPNLKWSFSDSKTRLFPGG
ncbi:hypothetical protein BDV06DRAFT_134441 [Aspergillus oleicola]